MKAIDRDNLRHMMERRADFALVEVLPPEQYRKFHLPGAINVPLSGDFDRAIQQAIPDRNRTVVVYCSDIECQASPTAAGRLDALGYTDVRDYADGKVDWKDAGLPIEGEGEEARRTQSSP